jgi:hypothetical protein
MKVWVGTFMLIIPSICGLAWVIQDAAKRGMLIEAFTIIAGVIFAVFWVKTAIKLIK